MFSQKKNKFLLFTFLVGITLFALAVNSAHASATWLSSITNNVHAPARIALDAKGNIYVTEPRDQQSVLIFDRQGNFLRSFGVAKGPAGIAVDAENRIYVGSKGTGSVAVYNPDLSLALKLGAGDGEFKVPTSILVSKAGLVYVADNKANLIKVYNRDGSLAFSFGGWGKANGQFNAPLGLAVDESKAELYVTDLGIFNDPQYSNAPTAGARVQVFDLAGAFKRSFGAYGAGAGKINTPMAIALDAAGAVYIADTYQGVVQVFDGAGAAIETIYDAGHPLKTPLGIAIGKDNRLFVTSANTPAVEVFCLAGCTDLSAAPLSLDLSAQEGGAAPAAQTITVSNSGTGALSWTVSSSATWIAPVAQAANTTGPSSSTPLSLAVNPAGLAQGVYDGAVTITADSGATATVAVKLTVTPPPAVLTVAPTALSFTMRQNGPAPAPQSVSIYNTGAGSLSWSASATAGLKLSDPAAGAAPASVLVSVAKTDLPAGTHLGSVAVTAPNAKQSPMNVAVTIQVISAGTVTVTSNIDEAGFDIKGPATFSGSGKSWRNDAAPPGDYTITFKAVSGYQKVPAKTFTVASGKETAVTAEYTKKAQATHIVAGAGGGSGKKVVVLPLDGTPGTSFVPSFKGDPESIRVATGDLDGSGIDKIVATDHKKTVKVYTQEGTELASYQLPDTLRDAPFQDADVAVADLNGDGKAEIILAAQQGGAKKRFKRLLNNDNKAELHDAAEQISGKKRMVIRLLAYTAGTLEDKGAIHADNQGKAFGIAAGDINGDTFPELLLADEANLRAFTVQLSAAGGTLTPLWTVAGEFGGKPQLAVGDLNGDGKAEIAVSGEQTEGADGAQDKKETGVVRMFKGTGEEYGLTIAPFGDLGYEKPAAVALGDIDGDGSDELVAGAGRDEHNEALVRIYESDGAPTGATIKAMDGKFGVTVSLGRFQ